MDAGSSGAHRPGDVLQAAALPFIRLLAPTRIGILLIVSRVKPRQNPALLRRLLRAKDRLDAASHEYWTVVRLAAVSGISPAHFARSFKTAFGVPPHRYLLSRRIERAKALLRDTDEPVTEIAFQTGWDSLGTFGRVFRDITGENPSDLRARERSGAHSLDEVPHCFVAAAYRPDLTIAVSEKRRRDRADTPDP